MNNCSVAFLFFHSKLFESPVLTYPILMNINHSNRFYEWARRSFPRFPWAELYWRCWWWCHIFIKSLYITPWNAITSPATPFILLPLCFILFLFLVAPIYPYGWYFSAYSTYRLATRERERSWPSIRGTTLGLRSTIMRYNIRYHGCCCCCPPAVSRRIERKRKDTFCWCTSVRSLIIPFTELVLVFACLLCSVHLKKKRHRAVGSSRVSEQATGGPSSVSISCPISDPFLKFLSRFLRWWSISCCAGRITELYAPKATDPRTQHIHPIFAPRKISTVKWRKTEKQVNALK